MGAFFGVGVGVGVGDGEVEDLFVRDMRREFRGFE